MVTRPRSWIPCWQLRSSLLPTIRQSFPVLAYPLPADRQPERHRGGHLRQSAQLYRQPHQGFVGAGVPSAGHSGKRRQLYDLGRSLGRRSKRLYRCHWCNAGHRCGRRHPYRPDAFWKVPGDWAASWAIAGSMHWTVCCVPAELPAAGSAMQRPRRWCAMLAP